MSQQQGTPISKLGEFGLIEHLTKQFDISSATTKLGVGDDAAVMEFGDQQTLVTTDLFLEGIHFDLMYTPLRHLGYKAVVVNVSDILAMNGHPSQITVSIGVSSKFTVEMTEELYAGIKTACDEYGLDLVGGDTSASLTGLTISITCIGTAKKEEIVCRSGAKNTDLICVSGDLGGAYMGLQLLEREKEVFKGSDKNVQPDFSGFEYILQKQLKPEARIDVIDLLRKEGVVPTSMIDISDGLASELMHIGKSSKVGTRIYEERLPIDYQTAKLAEELNLNVSLSALNGGEDYELLFTVPLALHDKVMELPKVRIIGYVTEESKGHALITRDQEEVELKAQGWPEPTQE